MKIQMTPKAYWHLQWLCQRTPNEVSCMGVLNPETKHLRIQDVVLVKQEVSEMHVDLDMEWWADHQVELFEKEKIQPWQTSVWIHTHPSGINEPSGVDEQTMRESFGSWSFAVMIILTKAGKFYARVDLQHEFPNGTQLRFSVPSEIEILWGAKSVDPVSKKDLTTWESEFKERVIASGISFFQSGFAPLELDHTSKMKKGSKDRTQTEMLNDEEQDYVETCNRYGMDPADPQSYEAIYGYWPSPGDLEFLGYPDACGYWD
ncbi:MAG: hypothetical protein KC964_23910 [Candidatus Omnitrophica bacterium]|nr:hypothetical protein [Candidatus Omnitrophota bacterium]